MLKSIDTTLGLATPTGWLLRTEIDHDRISGVLLRRDTNYDRAYSFAFEGPNLIVEVTAWPDNDLDFRMATFALHSGTLLVRGGDDVQISEEDLAVVTEVAVHLDQNF